MSNITQPVEQVEQAKQVEQLRSRIREACGDNAAMRYIDIIALITDTKYGSDTVLKEKIGDELYQVIDYLLKNLRTLYPQEPETLNTMNDEITDIVGFRDRVDKWIIAQQQRNKVYSLVVDILQKWIKDNKKVFLSSDPRVVALQADILKAHNEELIKGWHVTHFYSDGEITSTKGGEIYGMRSTFSMQPPVLNKFELHLPLEFRKEITYAIVTDEQANTFRKRMLEISTVQTVL